MTTFSKTHVAEDDFPRKLTVILQMDVVEYSRLMEVDEAGTLTRLRKHRRKLIDPTISAYYGRIVKLMGDGTLVEFPSVVDAAVCALKIQAGMDERNRDISGSQQIRFRIGINLGDVIVEGEDIHGDGVNITARLEALANPGGLCISGIVFDTICNKLSLQYDFIGKQTVKNIANPLRVYRVELKAGATLPEPSGLQINRLKIRLLPVAVGFVAFAIISTMILFINRTIEVHINHPIKSSAYSQLRPTIAVKPFTNMSGDPNQEYFSIEISDAIVAELSRLSYIDVRNDLLHDGSKDKRDTQQIKEGFNGQQYMLEGSARKDDERVHITAQLIETKSRRHLWVERYDSELKDIFQIQDDILKQVIDALTNPV